MDYINAELFEKKGLEIGDVELLLIIKQQRSIDLESFLSRHLTPERLARFEATSLVERVKAKKKSDGPLKLLRLSAKGSELLDDVSTPEASQGDLEMRDFLCTMYLEHEDEERVLGNKKLIGIYCAQMRNRLGLTLHEFYWLCYYFLQSFVYTRKLENIFFNKKDNPYGKFKDNMESSPLFQFYEQHLLEIKEFWKLKIKDYQA